MSDNLVLSIRNAVENNLLKNSELFVFTDNTTAEAAFFKGTLKAHKLFELVLNLCELQLNKGLHIHMINIAGKHMIAQGTDASSCGGEFSGSMLSLNMLKFIPLHQSALEHEPATLEEWITS